jgi:hypothetical protein
VDEGQLPSGGWLLAAATLLGILGAFLRDGIASALAYLGWRRAKDRERDAELSRQIKRAVADHVETAMSPIRQHIAEVQKGV